jgi:hypothetical protein
MQGQFEDALEGLLSRDFSHHGQEDLLFNEEEEEEEEEEFSGGSQSDDDLFDLNEEWDGSGGGKASSLKLCD